MAKRKTVRRGPRGLWHRFQRWRRRSRARREGPILLRHSRSLSTKLEPRLIYLMNKDDDELRDLRLREWTGLLREWEDSSRELEKPRHPGAAPILTWGLRMPEDVGTWWRPTEPPPQASVVSALIDYDGGEDDLARQAISVRSRVGNRFTVFATFSQLNELMRSDALHYVELTRPLTTNLDSLGNELDVAHIHMPTWTLGRPKGANVIVGVVDLYLDFAHPAFRTSSGDTRILEIWDQEALGSNGPDLGNGPLEGRRFTRSFIDEQIHSLESSTPECDAELFDVIHPRTDRSVESSPRSGPTQSHGTRVTGIAAGSSHNGYEGLAPEADILFVNLAGISLYAPAQLNLPHPAMATESEVADALNALVGCQWLFERASELGKPCVVNMSMSHQNGPHDGSTLYSTTLDQLLAGTIDGGRALSVAAGNLHSYRDFNNANQIVPYNLHAMARVETGATVVFRMRYRDILYNGTTYHPYLPNAFELWFDGQDVLEATLEIPDPAGGSQQMVLLPSTGSQPNQGPDNSLSDPPSLTVDQTTIEGFHGIDARNGDHCITVLVGPVPEASQHPLGEWKIALTGIDVVNGVIEGWIGDTEPYYTEWLKPQTPSGDPAPDAALNVRTLGDVPGCTSYAVTVGNHTRHTTAAGTRVPRIAHNSGRGGTRRGRTKPEIATVGTDVRSPTSEGSSLLDQNRPNNGLHPGHYDPKSGTSFAAPVVAGTQALLFECRGPKATWSDLKYLLGQMARPAPPSSNISAFGWGYLHLTGGCSLPDAEVDVWLRKSLQDDGSEPFIGNSFWDSPDILLRDLNGDPTSTTPFDASARFNRLVDVVARNRGTHTARDVEVSLYWAEIGTTTYFPLIWNRHRVFVGSAPDYLTEDNKIVISTIKPGKLRRVRFAWSPPYPRPFYPYAPYPSPRANVNHFCLLATLDTAGDPQGPPNGLGYFRGSNNIAIRNIEGRSRYVEVGDLRVEKFEMSFCQSGQPGFFLLVHPANRASTLEIAIELPLNALPWRRQDDLDSLGQLREVSSHAASPNRVLAAGEVPEVSSGSAVRRLTDVQGAKMLQAAGDKVRLICGEEGTLHIPSLSLLQGSRVPVVLRVRRLRGAAEQFDVCIGQLSGGQTVGGITYRFQ